jgi:hypothetical protein
VIGDRRLIVDMTFVTSVGERGRALLARWYAEGAQLIATSRVSRDLAESILGEPLPDQVPVKNSLANGTWLPFRASFVTPLLLVTLLVAALLFPPPVQAAKLKAETVAAWDEYLESVNAALQDRVRPGASFLWAYEDTERIAKLRSGEIAVAPAPGPNPRKVPGGLIHHWIGAAFLPAAKLEDILEVTQDYDRYKEFYRPSVIESKAAARGVPDDRFSMLLMNKALFLKMAVDADYQATNVRLDDRRFYSVSRSTRVQEIENYGQSSQRRLPEGEGGGYIWKLFSVARLERRDGGVYVEMEAVALSREIPGAVRLIVEPIVRGVSRNSMLTSIKQTEEAVRRKVLAGMIPANLPAPAEHLSGASAVLKNNASAFTQLH